MPDIVHQRRKAVVPVVSSTVNIALWLYDRARQEEAGFSARRMMNFLWIAQNLYAAMNHGRMLMPATFTAGENGPEERNIYHLFENGRPSLPRAKVAPEN